METRTRKLNINKVGGNASAGAKRASIGLPMPWLEQMDLNEDYRDVNLSFDGKRIIIEKKDLED
ncbi:hypothetical protein EAI30_15155 [Romboutsia ilealis]|uniref:PemI n=1 Tax=Romboutsia faecis TaxID=2764597 RepID=A0ABR7JTQ6_9FIRM|nr:hypothetical protein [Romboutsia faecis]MBC5998298.1 hypothetical protein [Romboutsia faecis]MRN25955.1 hypothetical protein [Romboutsia ilealis]